MKLFKHLILTCLVLLVANNSYSESYLRIIKAKTSFEVIKHLQHCAPDTLVFIDIDETIITPLSKTFRSAPHNRLIADIHENKSSYKNYEEIVSNWRLQRKIILVDSNWPSSLKRLKQKFPVYALTKLKVGKFGSIQSMQQWRYKELKLHDIEFTEHIELSKITELMINRNDSPIFLNGIFVTGSASKGQTLEKFHEHLKCSTLVLIDDLYENLEDVKKYCKKYDINFIGILFQGVENLNEKPNAEIARFQKEFLIKNAQWLEDDEAFTRMHTTTSYLNSCKN